MRYASLHQGRICDDAKAMGRTLSVAAEFKSGTNISFEVDFDKIEDVPDTAGVSTSTIEKNVDLRMAVTNGNGEVIVRDGLNTLGLGELSDGENGFAFESGTARVTVAQRQIMQASDTARELMREAAGLVVPSPALERVARRHFPADAGSWVIPDAALTPAAYHAMSAWLPDHVAGSRRRGLNRYAAGLRHLFSWPRPGEASEGPTGVFDGDADAQAEHLPEDTARVVWFGRHGRLHAKFGMGLLGPALPELERAYRHRPIELIVISNNRVKFDALRHKLKIFTRYEPWSNERVFFELARADLFVMPGADDPFSMCKSANRAVLALADGVPVAASYLEALEPLRDALIIDDWRLGIETYLFDSGGRSSHLALAQAALARHFSTEAIARNWHGTLTEQALPGRSASPAGLSPAGARRASPRLTEVRP